jgi:hypothetical protein
MVPTGVSSNWPIGSRILAWPRRVPSVPVVVHPRGRSQAQRVRLQVVLEQDRAEPAVADERALEIVLRHPPPHRVLLREVLRPIDLEANLRVGRREPRQGKPAHESEDGPADSGHIKFIGPCARHATP